MDVVTYALSKKASKSYTDNVVAGLGEGIQFQGAVETYADLPKTAEPGETYVVYTDESTTPAGTNIQYVYGYDESIGGNGWVPISSNQDGIFKYIEAPSNNPVHLDTLETGFYLIDGYIYDYETSAPVSVGSTLFYISTSANHVTVHDYNNNVTDTFDYDGSSWNNTQHLEPVMSTDLPDLNYQSKDDMVTSISGSSTNNQYPTAKAVYDYVQNTPNDTQKDLAELFDIETYDITKSYVLYDIVYDAETDKLYRCSKNNCPAGKNPKDNPFYWDAYDWSNYINSIPEIQAGDTEENAMDLSLLPPGIYSINGWYYYKYATSTLYGVNGVRCGYGALVVISNRGFFDMNSGDFYTQSSNLSITSRNHYVSERSNDYSIFRVLAHKLYELAYWEGFHTYKKGDFIFGKNGDVYESKDDGNYYHNPDEDTSQTYWKKWNWIDYITYRSKLNTMYEGTQEDPIVLSYFWQPGITDYWLKGYINFTPSGDTCYYPVFGGNSTATLNYYPIYTHFTCTGYLSDGEGGYYIDIMADGGNFARLRQEEGEAGFHLEITIDPKNGEQIHTPA